MFTMAGALARSAWCSCVELDIRLAPARIRSRPCERNEAWKLVL